MFCIVPIHLYLWKHYYNFDQTYTPDSGHLWFLGNIFAYVILLLPVFYYMKRNENGRVVIGIKKLMSTPLGLLPIIVAFVAEALIIKPVPYEMYAMTWHGFFLGLLAFFSGFCMVISGETFWNMILKWRWLFFVVAVALFVFRFNQIQMRVPGYLLALESNFWIFSVFAFAYRYLNRGGNALRYLSQAAYPVYILHMIFLYAASMFVFRWDIDVRLQFVLVLLFTIAGCFVSYECIRRVNVMRPLFGLGRG
jgi:membrane-bound acyltransferase YfiQ involved in biofilm formation